MSTESQSNFKAINDMRDRALLLLMGSDYVCETPALKRFGKDIESNGERIREDIASLKQRYPGKFTFELNTDDIIDKIVDTAGRLQEYDPESDQDCASGALGRELIVQIDQLARAVREIRAQVEGESPTYSSKDSLLKGVEVLKSVGSTAGKAANRFSKLLVISTILFILIFSYLYFTMEKEGPLLKEMALIEMRIEAQRELISELDKEKKTVSGEINLLKNMRQDRRRKIEVLELSGKLHDIEGKITQAEAEIGVYEKEIQELQAKIDKLRNQSFPQRLLHM